MMLLRLRIASIHDGMVVLRSAYLGQYIPERDGAVHTGVAEQPF